MARSDWFSTEEWLRAEHPQAGRPQLFMVRREWMGRRVAVRYIKARGHAYQRTSMGWKWGTLVPAERDEHIAVRDKDGTVHNVHYRRITDVYDLTRRLCAARHYHVEHGHLLGHCDRPLGHDGDHSDRRGTWNEADARRGRAANAAVEAARQARREADHREYLARKAEREGGTR